jgi:hypothetical protein
MGEWGAQNEELERGTRFSACSYVWEDTKGGIWSILLIRRMVFLGGMLLPKKEAVPRGPESHFSCVQECFCALTD